MTIYITLFVLLFNLCFAYEYEFSICAIFRDDAPYLREWIEFHKLVGAQHFYLANHNSKDNYKEILEPYIKTGLVELIEIQSGPDGDDVFHFTYHIQCKYYTNCVNLSKGKTKWLALIDTDEFLFPIDNYSILPVLKQYEEFGGIGVNWQVFGTSNVKKKDNQLLIEILTKKAPIDYSENTLIKSIVRPERVLEVPNPHYAIYLPEFKQVNTDKVPFEGGRIYPQINKLRINHYTNRDEKFFHHVKLPRKIKWGISQDEVLLINKELYNVEEDKTIFKYIPRLKKNILFRKSYEKLAKFGIK